MTVCQTTNEPIRDLWGTQRHIVYERTAKLDNRRHLNRAHFNILRPHFITIQKIVSSSVSIILILCTLFEQFIKCSFLKSKTIKMDLRQTMHIKGYLIKIHKTCFCKLSKKIITDMYWFIDANIDNAQFCLDQWNTSLLTWLYLLFWFIYFGLPCIHSPNDLRV